MGGGGKWEEALQPITKRGSFGFISTTSDTFPVQKRKQSSHSATPNSLPSYSSTCRRSGLWYRYTAQKQVPVCFPFNTTVFQLGVRGGLTLFIPVVGYVSSSCRRCAPPRTPLLPVNRPPCLPPLASSLVTLRCAGGVCVGVRVDCVGGICCGVSECM